MCREITEDGKQLLFDHGAPYFTVEHSGEVIGMVNSWEVRGLVAEWKETFGALDLSTGRFLDIEKVIMIILIMYNFFFRWAHFQ